MAEIIALEEQSNYETFRECLSEPILKSLSTPPEKPKKKKRVKKNSKTDITPDETEKSVDDAESMSNDAEDLGEFIDVRAPLHAYINK